MKFSFGVRQAIGVALLLIIAAYYIAIRAKGVPAGTLTPLIAVIAPLAALIAHSGGSRACCKRRESEG